MANSSVALVGGSCPTMGKIVYQYASPLVFGHLIKRYKRFLSDIEIDGGIEAPSAVSNSSGDNHTTVYCPNTGSLLTVINSNLSSKQPCVVSQSKNTNRKYEHTLEMIGINGVWVGIHSALANKIVYNALQEGLISECNGFTQILSEVSTSRDCKIDFQLLFGNIIDKKRKRSNLATSTASDDHMLLEVKSVTMKRLETSTAEFPDCVSARATKHAKFLTTHVKSGGRAAIVFLIQRSDVDAFTISSLDPEYQQAIHEAKTNGVLILPYTCQLVPQTSNIYFGKKVSFIDPFAELDH